jgi:hypothetical protein
MDDAVLPAEPDPSFNHRRSGRDIPHLFIDPTTGETPRRSSGRDFEANQLITEREGIESVPITQEIGHDAGAGSILPPDVSRLSLLTIAPLVPKSVGMDLRPRHRDLMRGVGLPPRGMLVGCAP